MPTPAFQFYPKDWMADVLVQSMTAEERGVYVMLLAIDWNEDGLPEDLELLAAICKTDRETVSTVVQRGFTETVESTVKTVKGDRFETVKKTNKRLQKERLAQSERRKQCSDAGKKSAQMRQQQGVFDLGSGAAETVANDRLTTVERPLNSSPAPASADSKGPNGPKRSRKVFKKPSIGELVTAFDTKLKDRPSAEFEAGLFLNYYESCGWKVGNKPMVSWPHAVANWCQRRLKRENYGRMAKNSQTRSSGTHEASGDVFDQIDH